MESQQLSLDVADLEIEALDLIPTHEVVGDHDVTEIGASICYPCQYSLLV
jgi:hypothetical protein